MRKRSVLQIFKFTIIFFVFVSYASADCYFRREVLSVGGLPITDHRESTTLQADNTYECTYSFNVLIDGVWTKAERVAKHKNKAHACKIAREEIQTFLLTAADEYEIDVLQNTEMVCDTRKEERKLYVDIGQEVNLSDLVIDPRFIDNYGQIQLVTPYDAPHMQCAIFLENVIQKDGVAIQNKGYACRTGTALTVWKKWEAARIDSNG